MSNLNDPDLNPKARSHAHWAAYDKRHLLAAVALVITLVLLWLAGYGPGGQGACCGAPVAPPATATTTATPIASAPATTPTPALANLGNFSATWKNQKLVMRGVVKDAATKDAMYVKAAIAVDTGNVVDELTVDAKAALGTWASDIDPIVTYFKDRGDSAVLVKGNGVVLTGEMATEAERTARGAWAQSYFGTVAKIDNQMTVAVAVAKADAGCADAIKAQIEFASGKALLTAAGKSVLDKVAKCLLDSKIEVAGHTDSQGLDAANQALSEARAQAVMAYLVSQGMNAAKLSAKGYGASKPIGDNAKAAGRQKNRRIAFTAQ